MKKLVKKEIGLKLLMTSILIACLCIVASKCSAQNVYDTIPCKMENVIKYVTIPAATAKGKDKTYMVYRFANNIQDLIPVCKTVMTYIAMCEDNKITPSLGIRLRNGEISSLVRVKTKIKK